MKFYPNRYESGNHVFEFTKSELKDLYETLSWVKQNAGKEIILSDGVVIKINAPKSDLKTTEKILYTIRNEAS